MSDQNDRDLDQVKADVRSSDTRVEILRELYSDPTDWRPSELVDVITPKTGKSDTNVYQSLNALVELSLVKKIESDGRATLYSLTDRGKEVAEELGLAETDDDSSSDDESESDLTDMAPARERVEQASGEALAFKGPEESSDDSPPDQRDLHSGMPPADQEPTTKQESDSQQESLLSHLRFEEDIDQERVDHVTNELNTLIWRTNLSIPELEAAVEQLKRRSKQ
jgi:DNA-binding transcriptional ArsR family regulator